MCIVGTQTVRQRVDKPVMTPIWNDIMRNGEGTADEIVDALLRNYSDYRNKSLWTELDNLRRRKKSLNPAQTRFLVPPFREGLILRWYYNFSSTPPGIRRKKDGRFDDEDLKFYFRLANIFEKHFLKRKYTLLLHACDLRYWGTSTRRGDFADIPLDRTVLATPENIRKHLIEVCFWDRKYVKDVALPFITRTLDARRGYVQIYLQCQIS
jgi:hypothetical protein